MSQRKFIDSVNEVSRTDDGYDVWMSDSGASCHVTPKGEKMHDVTRGGSDKIIVGDGTVLGVSTTGTLILKPDECESLTMLNDVKVVDNIEKNIISLGLLLKNGAKLTGSKNELIIKKGDDEIKFKKSMSDGLFYMRAKRVGPKENFVSEISKKFKKSEKS